MAKKGQRVRGVRSIVTREFMMRNLFLIGTPREFLDESGEILSEWYGNLEMKLKANKSIASQLIMKLIVEEDYVSRYRLAVSPEAKVIYYVEQQSNTGRVMKVVKEVFE
jgi:hypothetical protein